jgi:outer membrane protein TolC
VISYDNLRQLIAFLLLALALAAPVRAQTRPSPSPPPNSPFLGGVPQGTATAQPIALSVAQAIRRALEYNLGVIASEQNVDRALSARLIALSDLLPHVNATVAESRRVLNLEAFGFPLQGQFPALVGPFNNFDARVFLSQSVFDLRALRESRAEAHNVAAARLANRSARDVVVLVTANLYLQALAASARAESARAQRATALALQNQALDMKQSGIVAGIDVVRAEVRLSTERQRATATENDFQKAKLQLARVVGLPIGQPFNLLSDVPDLPMPDVTFEQALERAYRDRPDYQAALERVRAAEASRRAATGSALPSVRIDADYGALGLSPASARATYTIMGAVDVPIFEGGRQRGRVLEAEVELRARRSEAEDMRSSVYYDVRSAFLDLEAIGEELRVATRARELADQQLTQSRDRFAAGVANNIEVIQAQEAVALASEQYISAFYGYQVAKGVLAESLGGAEEAVAKYLGGSN